jgi:hypothetical protein
MKLKKAVDVSKIKARPLKGIDSQRQPSVNHNRHMSKGIIVIPSSEGSGPIRKTFQEEDFQEIHPSHLYGDECPRDERTSRINGSAGTTTRASTVVSDEPPASKGPIHRTSTDQSLAPLEGDVEPTKTSAPSSPANQRVVSHREISSRNPFGLISLSSGNEPRFTKAETSSSRKERRKERNPSYQSLTSLDAAASRTHSMNLLAKATPSGVSLVLAKITLMIHIFVFSFHRTNHTSLSQILNGLPLLVVSLEEISPSRNWQKPIVNYHP